MRLHQLWHFAERGLGSDEEFAICRVWSEDHTWRAIPFRGHVQSFRDTATDEHMPKLTQHFNRMSHAGKPIVKHQIFKMCEMRQLAALTLLYKFVECDHSGPSCSAR